MTTRRRIVQGGIALAGTIAWTLGRQEVASAATAGPFSYYIGPNGSDSNPGTLAQPWAITSIESKSALIAGKKVGLLDGSYRMPSTGTPNDGEWIRIDASGTATNPTVIAAVNSLKAVITGNNGGQYPQTPTYLFRVFGSNVTIQGLLFFQHSGAAISVTARSTLIEGCAFKDFDFGRIATQKHDNYGAVRTSGASDVTIRNCLFENIKNVEFDGRAQTRGHGIGPNFTTRGITVEFCTFVDVQTALYMKRDTGNYIFRNNFVLNTDQTTEEFILADNSTADGDQSWADTPSLMYNNVFVNINRLWGVSGEVGQNWQATYMYNNTFVFGTPNYGGNFVGMVWYPGAQSVGSGISRTDKVYNNIFAFNAAAGAPVGAPLASFRGGPTIRPEDMMLIHDYNAYESFAMTDNDINVTYRDIASWRAATGLDTHSIVGDAGIAHVDSNEAASFRLSLNSKCKNAGRVGGTPAGAVTDIGAWGGGATKIGSDLAFLRPAAAVVAP